MEFIFKIFALGGPVMLAVMGAYVIDKPVSKAVWYGLFGGVGLLTFGAALIDSYSQEEKLNTMLTGGNDNFPEIFAVLSNNNKLPLLIAASGKDPLFDVTYSIQLNGKDSPLPTFVAAQNWGTLLSGAWPTGVSLGVGFYQITFDARNGKFFEMLAVENCKGRLGSASYITKPLEGGRLMQTTPHDPDCFKSIPLRTANDPPQAFVGGP